MTRQPLKFDVNRSPATLIEAAPAPKAKAADASKKQVGARIPADLYRQLKSRAALQGQSVQECVEQAIAKFLA